MVPTGWIHTTIGNVYQVVGGGTPSTAREEYWKGNIPWITSADIEGVRDIRISRYITKQAIENSTTNRVPSKTLLVVTRVGLGKIAIAQSDICFSQDLQGLIAPPELILPEFGLHYLSFALQALKYEGRGTTISGITKKQLKDANFPLPPLNEQKRIVAKIEELFSELDKGIENLKTAREQLKVYRQAILKHAFEGKLIKKTTVWSERSVKQVTTYITSGSRGWAQYYADSGDLFIRAQNLKFDRLDLTDIAFVNIPNNAEGTRTKIQKGDLLITITGANVTKSALVESEIGTAYVSQHVALCRLTDEVFSKFLYWFMVAESAGRKQLNKAAYGAGKPGLNLDNIKDVKLLLPSYEEQISIVEIIETKLSVCEKFERDIENQIDNCTALRQAILKRAFSGKLVAQDPKDEPASVLLERIKAEKNENQKRKKKVA